MRARTWIVGIVGALAVGIGLAQGPALAPAPANPTDVPATPATTPVIGSRARELTSTHVPPRDTAALTVSGDAFRPTDSDSPGDDVRVRVRPMRSAQSSRGWDLPSRNRCAIPTIGL